MIYVRDNFFTYPNEIRNTALNQIYQPCPVGSWPGYRSDVPKEISNIILNEVKKITGNKSLKYDPSVFQYIPKSFGEGLYHWDIDWKYTCINYLSISPMQDSGTLISDRNVPFNSDKYWDDLEKIKFPFFKDNKSFFKRQRFNKIKKRHNSNFNLMSKVSNKFNRFVVFDSLLYHRAEKFFGDTVDNSRLTIVSFLHD